MLTEGDILGQHFSLIIPTLEYNLPGASLRKQLKKYNHGRKKAERGHSYFSVYIGSKQPVLCVQTIQPQIRCFFRLLQQDFCSQNLTPSLTTSWTRTLVKMLITGNGCELTCTTQVGTREPVKPSYHKTQGCLKYTSILQGIPELPQTKSHIKTVFSNLTELSKVHIHHKSPSARRKCVSVAPFPWGAQQLSAGCCLPSQWAVNC